MAPEQHGFRICRRCGCHRPFAQLEEAQSAAEKVALDLAGIGTATLKGVRCREVERCEKWRKERLAAT